MQSQIKMLNTQFVINNCKSRLFACYSGQGRPSQGFGSTLFIFRVAMRSTHAQSQYIQVVERRCVALMNKQNGV